MINSWPQLEAVLRLLRCGIRAVKEKVEIETKEFMELQSQIPAGE